MPEPSPRRRAHRRHSLHQRLTCVEQALRLHLSFVRLCRVVAAVLSRWLLR